MRVFFYLVNSNRDLLAYFYFTLFYAKLLFLFSNNFLIRHAIIMELKIEFWNEVIINIRFEWMKNRENLKF